MPEQSPFQLPDHNQEQWGLDASISVNTWRHQNALLNRELDLVCHEMAAARRKITLLVGIFDRDQVKLRHQQARIGELESEVRRLTQRSTAESAPQSVSANSPLQQVAV